MADSLTIWCNAELPPTALEALRAGIGAHTLQTSARAANNLSAGDPGEPLSGIDIAFGQPDPTRVMEADRLRWVHITSAGYTRYDTEPVRARLAASSVPFTNSSSVYADPCAQHVLGLMLSAARQLPFSFDASKQGAWSYDYLRPIVRVLEAETVLIVGFGAIGQRLAELLAPFGLRVIGFRRTPRGDELVPVLPLTELDAHLPAADHVVNILPASPSTNGFFGAERFARMNADARYYNIGRGSTVNQEAMIDALEEGRLAAAYLDVTDPEPLPDDHPLWAAPNCFITPHVAGGRQEEGLALVRHFLANLHRFEAGEALQDVVFPPVSV